MAAKRKGSSAPRNEKTQIAQQRHKPQKAQQVQKIIDSSLTPTKELAAIVGARKMLPQEANKRVWLYVKRNNLQDRQEKRMISPDASLKKIVDAKSVSMFEMTKCVRKHLK